MKQYKDNHMQKEVVIKYWHNGIEHKKIVRESYVELTVKSLRMCGVSGIKILRGNTSKK